MTFRLAPLLTLAGVLWTVLGQPHVGAAEHSNRAASAVHSELWGVRGERWSPDSRLPDFSYAGYWRGERALPTRKPDCSVRDFGAVGDGRTDDTAAFQRALAESPGKVICIPPGTYLITNILTIRSSGTVLQDEDAQRSVLKFTMPLNTIKPNSIAGCTAQSHLLRNRLRQGLRPSATSS